MGTLTSNSGITLINPTDSDAAVDSVSNANGTLTVSPNTGAVVVSRAAITGPITIAAGSNASVIASGNTYPTPTFSGTATPQGLVDISGAAAGQIKFPATQNASSDANTLDDYEEGTWTPVYTYGTPGDLSVAYTTQVGDYTKVGNQITINCSLQTSTHTYTTASGNSTITGFPFVGITRTGIQQVGSMRWAGITKVGYTQISPSLGSAGNGCVFPASGSAVAVSNCAVADCPSGTQQLRFFNMTYIGAT